MYDLAGVVDNSTNYQLVGIQSTLTVSSRARFTVQQWHCNDGHHRSNVESGNKNRSETNVQHFEPHKRNV